MIASRIQTIAYVQMILYLAIWLFGIYINGFVPSPESTGGTAISLFLNPLVITHFVLGVSTAAVGITLLTLGWVYKLRNFELLTSLSLASIAIAATGGLTYVFGAGNQNFDSMLMATAFITAFYLTFASLLAEGSFPRKSSTIVLSLSVLALFFVVFLSGMYVNLFLASSVFSKPPAVARQMLSGLVTSPAGLVHETSGVLLLTALIALTVSLFHARLSRLASLGIVSSLLVIYSLLQGVLSNVLPIFDLSTVAQSGLVNTIVEPMTSAAGFLISIIIVMIILHSLYKRTTRPAVKSRFSS